METKKQKSHEPEKKSVSETETKKTTLKTKQKLDSSKEHYAKAKNLNVSISTKHSIEIFRKIRGKELKKAKRFLEQVINKKAAVPFKKFNRDVGHKPGKIASGRYPIKASQEVLRLLNSAEANAENKGLDVNNLVIKETIANSGSNIWHFGRKRRRRMKRTHLEVRLEEIIK